MSTRDREYKDFDDEDATATANRKRGSAMASSMLRLEDMESPARSNVVESASKSKMLPCCRFALLSIQK
jgi:hypothetical protein